MESGDWWVADAGGPGRNRILEMGNELLGGPFFRAFLRSADDLRAAASRMFPDPSSSNSTPQCEAQA